MLVGVDLGMPNFDAGLEELGLLAQTAGLEPAARITCKRKAPDAALFVGSGKADEIRQLAADVGATEILFDQSLSPAQQRNLERHMELPVNDRTLLILEIFAQRARSHEGKLQVELARLQYLSTRLVRRWSHLERQRGGIGNVAVGQVGLDGAGGVSDRHAKSLCPMGNGLADAAHADDAHARARNLAAQRQRPLRPAAGAHKLVGQGDLAAYGEDQTHGQVGHVVAEHPGRVGHGKAQLDRCGHIDAVITDAKNRHHFGLRQLAQEAAGHDGLASGGDSDDARGQCCESLRIG